MTTADAILADILAHPEDDALRLIYADVIEDTQPERAEFIRVQVELANPRWRNYDLSIGKLLRPARSEEWDKLSRKERDLFHSVYVDGLPGPFVPNLDGYLGRNAPHACYRRGFVEKVILTLGGWAIYADALTARQPIREVRLLDWRSDTSLAIMQERWPHITFHLPV